MNLRTFVVACLILNKEAIALIQKEYANVEIISCKESYDNYPTQSSVYIDWELPFVKELRAKDNPDFPRLKLTTPSTDLDKIANSVVKAIKKVVNKVIEFDIDVVENSTSARNVNIEVETDDSVVLPPYNTVADVDEAKIRVFITRFNDRTEIVITPLIFPRLDSNRCQIIKNVKK